MKQVNHLVAKKSPLGWVIFGSTPGDGMDVTTTVLHVKYANPVDLSDFWTTEAMGVAVDPCICACKQAKPVRMRREENHRRIGKKGRRPMVDPLPMETRPERTS